MTTCSNCEIKFIHPYRSVCYPCFKTHAFSIKIYGKYCVVFADANGIIFYSIGKRTTVNITTSFLEYDEVKKVYIGEILTIYDLYASPNSNVSLVNTDSFTKKEIYRKAKEFIDSGQFERQMLARKMK